MESDQEQEHLLQETKNENKNMALKNKPDENIINTIIEKLGTGRFSYILIMKLSTVYFIYGVEMTLLGIIAPFMKCYWSMTDLEVGFMTSTVLAGESIGFILWGWLGDVYGRKPILVVTLFIAFLFSFLTIFSTNFFWFAAIRLFVGIGVASFYIPTCILSEYLPIRMRGVGILASMLSYNFGSTFIAGMAWVFLLHDKWKVFIGIASAPVLFSLMISLSLPESIRFLANNSKINKLHSIFNDIATAHGKKQVTREDVESIKPLDSLKDRNFGALFVSRKRGLTTLATTALLSTCVMIYYGLIVWNTDLQQQFLNSDSHGIINNASHHGHQCQKLKSGDYKQNLIISTSGLVGTLSSMMLVDSVGRKKPIVFSLMLVAGLILSLNFKMSYISFSVVMFLGRGAISLALSATNVFINELFSTSFRSKANGFAQFCATLFAALGPYLIQYASHRSMLTVTILMTVFCIVGAVACITQRETKDMPVDIDNDS